MTSWACRVARDMLQACHDGELSIEDQVKLETHADSCAACATEAQRIAALGESLRTTVQVRLGEAPPLESLQASVIARMAVDRHQAWSNRLMRVVDDPHVVWAGLGATVATVVCVALASATLHFAAPRRADSLAGILSVLASPGSNENPVRPAPHVSWPRVEAGVMSGVLLGTMVDRHEDVFALAAVLTSEGRLIELEVLAVSDEHRHDVEWLLDVASAARFEPAKIGKTAVALNVVWVMAHTTVVASSS